MSRPESLMRASGRGTVGAVRDVAPVPLRVVAERLSAEEARAVDEAEAARRAAAHRPTAVISAVGSALSTMAPPLSPSSPPGVTAPPAGALSPVAAPGLPVPITLPPRRSMIAELVALLTGRQRMGRHRPDTVHRHAWSMFAPERRPRRRRWHGGKV